MNGWTLLARARSVAEGVVGASRDGGELGEECVGLGEVVSPDHLSEVVTKYAQYVRNMHNMQGICKT